MDWAPILALLLTCCVIVGKPPKSLDFNFYLWEQHSYFTGLLSYKMAYLQRAGALQALVC